jgi:hypothetical protein
MNITAANWTEFKGQTVTIQTANGDALEGSLISLNSKGWNIKTDEGKVITRTQGVTVDISTGGVEGVEDLPDDFFLEADNDEGFEEGDSTREFEELTDAEIVAADDAQELTTAEYEDLSGDDEGHTTAELAEIFETTARELRKTLRALGLGVGRGRRYNLTDADVTKVRERVTKA